MGAGAESCSRSTRGGWSCATLELGTLAAVESCFALANGRMGLRGTLEEGEPHVRPGTYLNGVFEERPLPHAEAGYGYPRSGPDRGERH